MLLNIIVIIIIIIFLAKMLKIQFQLGLRPIYPTGGSNIPIAGGDGAGCYDDVIDEFARKKCRLSFAHK